MRRFSSNFFPEGASGLCGAHQRDEAADIEAFMTGIRVLLHDVLACDELIG